jgi:ABC-2 type transport system permease protein
VGLRRTASFLAALQATNLKSLLALRGAFWAQVVGMALNNLVFFAIWIVFFGRYETVAGWRLGDMAALYGTIATSFGLTALFAGGAMRLSNQVLEGRLDVALVQPKDPLVQLVASRMRASGIGDVGSGVLLLATSGVVAWDTLPLAALAVGVGAVVLGSTAVLAHSLVFFLGAVDALARQVVEFVVTFSCYPETVASGLLRVVLFTAIPAGFVSWVPVSLVREFTWGGLGLALGGAAAYAALALWVFRAGLRRYESSGRFGAAP